MIASSEKLILLDRDGVINEDSNEYIKTPDEWRPLSGSVAAIAALHEAGFRIVVISNQSGIARGLFTEAALDEIHRKMTTVVEAAGGKIDAIYYCPHHPDAGCDCRKPRTGMLDRLAADFGVSLDGVPLVGDKPADVELARATWARPLLVRTGYGQGTVAALDDRELEVFADLAAVAHTLISEPET